jgi:hypothetical protein
MQLTKSEILQTQMLVTTPEKWDVITRKGTGKMLCVARFRQKKLMHLSSSQVKSQCIFLQFCEKWHFVCIQNCAIIA